jgi:outer membrane cobalamin receptor
MGARPALSAAIVVMLVPAAAGAQDAGSGAALQEPQTVVVRAERLRAPVPVAGVQVLAADALVSAAPVRLDEVLRAKGAAALFRRSGSAVANATIQGVALRPLAPNGAGRAEVRIDGVPQNDPFGGWVAWGRLDPLFVDQVALARGASGAGSGPMALTGLIDITEVRGGAGAARLAAGSAGAVTAAGRLVLRPQEATGTLVVMGVHDRADGLIPVAEAARGPVDLRAGHELSGITAVATVGGDPDAPGGVLAARVSGFAERKGAGLPGGVSVTRGTDVSLAWRRAAGGLEGRVILYGQQRRFANRTVTAGAGRTSVATANDQFDTPASALGLTAQLALPDLPGAPVVEADLRQASGETRERFRFLTSAPTRQRQAGGDQSWAGLSVRAGPVVLPGSALELSGALRVDRWRHTGAVRIETDLATGAPVLAEFPADRSGTGPSGRLSLAWPDAGLVLHVARTIRLPSLNELHRPFRIGNDLTEANTALDPEQLSGADLIWTGQLGRAQLSATAWTAHLDGPVTNVTLGTGPGTFPRAGFLPAGSAYRERRNAGRIEASGLELTARWRGDWLDGGVMAAVTDAKVDGGRALPALTGKRPAQAPQWTLGADLAARFGAGGAWQAGLGLRAESARFEDDLNSRRLDSFAALDLSLARQIGPMRLALVVENAGDARVPVAIAGDGTVSLTGQRRWRLELLWREEP